MKPSLRLVTERAEASGLAPALDAYAAQALAEFRDTPLPEGVCRRFFDRHFEDSQSVLVIAESKRGAADLGVCLTGPFADPLTREETPMVLILYVSPDMRHRGLGSALIKETLRTLASRGHAKLAGRAGQNDDALISMGERWGFVRVWDLLVRE
jgi:GNAT superfamily N-acetyltransferase